MSYLIQGKKCKIVQIVRIWLSFTEHTRDIVRRANDLLVSGAENAFDGEFSLMQRDSNEIRNILSSVNFTHADLRDIQNMLEVVR